MTAAALHQAVGQLLGVAVERSRPVSGGDINQAHALELADGRTIFAKSNPRAPAGMFAAEARGLAFLAEARALRIPAVIAVGPEPAPGGGPGFLLLEHIATGPRRPDHDELLGRGLAALHRFGAPDFGLDHDNFIGRLPQANAPLPTWPAFYAQRRLLPQLRLARDRGLASRRLSAGVESVCARLDDLVGPAEPPARLHGDLWGGNAMVDQQGRPCLIDPAAHGGHREVDLAMMRLFGGFSGRTFAAYHEAFPLAPGHEARVPLYQLYFLLVHVNLFGSGYVGQVEAALASLS
jgi:fructosamine-3-kinase